MEPYYTDDAVTLYHGDSAELLWSLDANDFAVMVTDPPYGISYKSGQPRTVMAASISGDVDTSLRDLALAWWTPRPALVFGSWKALRPHGTRARLIWDTKGALGMGALDIPWKPADQEIYVLGTGFHGHRGNNVLTFAPVQSLGYNGREHPHEKPVDLLQALLLKCPSGPVLDPFAGTGATLRAAKNIGRKAIGIEIEERYCEITAQRCSQEVLPITA